MASDYLYMDFLLGYKKAFEVKTSCTEEEVNRIEQEAGVKFPRSYRELYLILGHFYGFGVIDENSFDFPDYMGMRKKAEAIISSSKADFQLNDDMFVFGCVVENGVFFFFKLVEGDNPPVYEYQEGDETYTMVTESFSSFVQRLAWYEGYLVRERRLRR